MKQKERMRSFQEEMKMMRGGRKEKKHEEKGENVEK